MQSTNVSTIATYITSLSLANMLNIQVTSIQDTVMTSVGSGNHQLVIELL